MQASAEVSECRFWLQLTASILGSRQLDDRKFALSSHLVGTHVRCYCPKCRGVPGTHHLFRFAQPVLVGCLSCRLLGMYRSKTQLAL